jgi:hypothetical protein
MDSPSQDVENSKQQGVSLLAKLSPLQLLPYVIGLIPFIQLLIFVRKYSINLPRMDNATRALYVVMDTVNGNLRLADLFLADRGQIAFPSMSLVALNTWLFNWNQHVEVGVVLVLAVINFLLLMFVVWKTEPRALPYVVFPASVIFFSVQNQMSWLVGYVGLAWLGTQLWVLLVLMLIWFGRSWRGWFPLVLISSVAITFSHGQGVVVWAVGLLAMLFSGERRPWLYAIWIITGGLAATGYLQLAAVSAEAGAGDTEALLRLDQLGGIVNYALAYLGNMFNSHEVAPARGTGSWAVVLALVNVAWLGWIYRDWRAVGYWLPIAGYSILTALVVGSARVGSGFSVPLNSWYILSTGYFWIALLVSSMLILLRSVDIGRLAGRVVATVNVVAWVWLGGLFVESNVDSLNRYIDGMRFLNHECHQQWLYVQEDTVPGCEIWYPEATNLLAYYDLGFFASYPQTNILQGLHIEGVPVVVEGAHDWINFHIQKWLLDGIPAADLVQVGPDDIVMGYNDYPMPYLPLTLQDAVYVREQVGEIDSLWYIRPDGTESRISGYWDGLLDDGFVATTFVHRTEVDVPIAVTRYERLLPGEVEDRYRFGDDIRLLASRVPSGETCGDVLVQTFWQSDAPTPVPYSITYSLLDPGGETVARADGQLSYTPSDTWQAGRIYLDERTFSLPCDIEGAYTMEVGVYDWRDGIRLDVYADDELTGRDLAVVASIGES